MRKETIVKDDGRYLIYYTFGEEDAALTSLPSPKSSDASRAARDEPVAGTPLPELGQGAGVRAAASGTGQEPEA